MKMANPRRRKRKSTRRRRRRNTGIAPFVAGNNPYILANPRRRRRSNPGLSMPRLTVKNVSDKLMKYGGGSLMGVGINVFGLNRIENDYWRNGARISAAVLGGMVLRGELGAAYAGAAMYPVWVEVAAMLNLPINVEADLDILAADLEQVLDNPEMVDW